MLTADKILPCIHRQTSVPEGEILRRPLVGELILAYWDGSQLLTYAQLAELGLSEETLFDLAVNNLSQRLTSLRGQVVRGAQFGLEEEGPVFTTLKVGQDLEACLLLLSHVWNKLAAGMTGELVVGVAGRDRIMFTSSDHVVGQLAMRKLMEAAHAQAGAHALSQELFVWRNPGLKEVHPIGTWQMFSEPVF